MPPTKRRGGRSRSGFTVIELLTVIVIIGFASAVVLPDMQDGREQFNEENTEQVLRELAASAAFLESASGHLPGGIFYVWNFAAFPTLIGPCCDAGGYTYSLVPIGNSLEKIQIHADPIAGVTGGKTCFVESPFSETPEDPVNDPVCLTAINSDVARKALLADIHRAGARRIGQLLANVALADDPGRLSPAPTADNRYAGQLDTAIREMYGGDAALTFRELLEYRGTGLGAPEDGGRLDGPLLGFIEDVAVAMKLGARGEDFLDIGVDRVPPTSDAEFEYFTYEGQRELTELMVEDTSLRSRLLGALRQAAQAQAAGNVRVEEAAKQRYGSLLDVGVQLRLTPVVEARALGEILEEQ